MLYHVEVPLFFMHIVMYLARGHPDTGGSRSSLCTLGEAPPSVFTKLEGRPGRRFHVLYQAHHGRVSRRPNAFGRATAPKDGKALACLECLSRIRGFSSDPCSYFTEGKVKAQTSGSNGFPHRGFPAAASLVIMCCSVRVCMLETRGCHVRK